MELVRSVNARDALKTAIEPTVMSAEVKAPKIKKYVVSIVGFNHQYTKEEVVDSIVSQNGFLTSFFQKHKPEDHIDVFNVKPLRNKPELFQAFARISGTVREGIKAFNNRLVLGLSGCRVYDQFHIKRCNACQKFGHYYKECPTPTQYVCSKCGENHDSRTCTSTQHHCINCKIRGRAESECKHTADSPDCFMIQQAQMKLKEALK